MAIIRALAASSRSATSTIVAKGRNTSLFSASAAPLQQQRRRFSVSSRSSSSVAVASAAAGRTVVSTDKAAAAVGPYSQAIKVQGGAPLLFVSGQVALIPGTKDLAPGGAAEQAEQCLKNLDEILRAGGSSLDSVVKTTVLLSDMSYFAEVNAVYGKYFSKDPKPARACFAVRALPLGALVEIEATAVAS